MHGPSATLMSWHLLGAVAHLCSNLCTCPTLMNARALSLLCAYETAYVGGCELMIWEHSDREAQHSEHAALLMPVILSLG